MSSDPRGVFASELGGRTSDSESFFSSFVFSMPHLYRDRFESDVLRQHATIVQQRGEASAHADVWQELPGGGVGICVVADDRPGLLSLISIALVRHELDVGSAQIYGRTLPSGRVEAVDLFWVSRADARRGQYVHAPDRMEITAMGRTLATLIERNEALLRDPHIERTGDRRAEADRPRRVRFAYEAEQSGCVLIVEAADRPGLLLTVARTLFELGTQIIRSDVMTIRGRAVDRFHVTELDGRPLSPLRRSYVELAIEQVLEQPFRPAATSLNGSSPPERTPKR